MLPYIFAATLGLAFAAAHAQPVFERPTYSPGDRWVFQYQRESDGTSGTWSRRIERPLPNDRLEVKHADGSLNYYDGAMNFVGRKPGGDPRELARFPMRVGDSWSFVRRFDNPNIEDQGWVHVVAYESITVPAGTFDCFRVEARLSSVNENARTASTSVRWYCPAIKWIAKEHFEDTVTAKYTLGSRLSQTSVLLRYRSGDDQVVLPAPDGPR